MTTSQDPHDIQLPAPGESARPAVPSRRAVLGGVAALGLSACSATPRGDDPTTQAADQAHPAAARSSTAAEGGTGVAGFDAGPPIGDGSTSEQRPQPGQRKGAPLTADGPPPQLVVVSWDGAGALPNDQLSRFREVARRTKAHMTLFLSGMYFVPEGKRMTYHPPAGHKPGSSDIPFLTEASVRRTITGIGEAWVEGHEIGTHFNGHWCGPRGVASWSGADWSKEIDEAVRFVTSWRTITGFDDLPRLPFDYRKELIGGRTPCLEGRTALLPVAKKRGWRYDSSGNATLSWPRKHPNGLWDLSMPSVTFRGRPTVAMDYNFMYQQSNANPKGDPSQHARWQAEALGALKGALDLALAGNRAPMIVGNHFEQWNGGIYMNVVEQFMDYAASHPEVQLVSMRELCDLLDAQDPAVLAALRRLAPGQAPAGGWAELFGAAAGGGHPGGGASGSATASGR